jgi:hypothetical protein
MRWGGDGHGAVGASAYTLACRDENASYYYYQEPAVPSTPSARVLRPGQARGSVHVKKPPDKPQARKVTGSHARDSSAIAEEAAADRPEEASVEPESTGRPPLIVCAGRSVYGSNNDSSSNNSHANQHGVESLGKAQGNWDDNDRHTSRPVKRPATAVKLKRASEPCSPPRYRTDEELEQIIRDLRDQVFHNQHKQELLHREKAAPPTSHNDGKGAQKHQRRHLKNPVEKMEASVPVAASLGAGNGPLLQRPLSSGCLSRLVTESTVQMVVPAIMNEAAPAAGRGGNRTRCNNAVEVDLRSYPTTTMRSRPSSSCDGRSEEQPSTRIGEVAVLNPRHSRPKNCPGKLRIRREVQVERAQSKEPLQHRYERLSDHSHSDSFLYLVDVDDSEDDPESLALSPVGPWVVGDFASARVATSTPRSPSVSTCYSLSSSGSDDFDCGGREESSPSELAALSPRSRLLYFSARADDGEVTRSTFPQLHHRALRRSATCGSGLITSAKLANLEAQGAKPKRCSSAKATTRSRPRPAPSTRAAGSRQKAATRVNQARKRPQSGGAGSSRSSARSNS